MVDGSPSVLLVFSVIYNMIKCSYYNQIKFCCIHIVVLHFFYKNDRISTFYLASRVGCFLLPYDDNC
jgi:hypothetical protein